ncbi:hypothetical protein CH63R_01597 [Colletotrichum higginsianum IMI 349063]|uniref:Uncharacterized protein n=1 Tax=Colletotrichum higginsianum (strain IMI 349063) TaxID=759273 RepID=A0A1B7YWI6_COLHI|nr:hypothetical protein CH63R_01597 [Colletotrichum higginsianum IMI 349063]OBR16417.1 hypothetical protein CH63R_01597 [Colletotrichum higginsianum IMI 349063]
MVAQPPNTAARQESAPQPSGQGPTPTACVEVKELFERQDDTTRITITQTLPRTLSTRTATVTLHGGIPTEPPPRSSEGVSNQQLGAIIGGEDFLDDKYPPPSPDFGPPRPPPTYSRPPPGPIHSQTSPASENTRPPTSSGTGHIPHPPTAPVSTKYPPRVVPTRGNQRPSTNYSASWVPPPIDRSGVYPAQPHPNFTLPSRSKPPSTFQPGPLKSGVTAMPRGGPLRAGTAPTPRPSVYIPIPPPPHRPKIVTADPGRISGSSSKIKHAPGFPGHGRPGMISSIGNTPRVPTSFQQPPKPVLPAPFSGLHGEKKTVKFPDVLEESIPELPIESDLPSPEHKKGSKKSTPIPPSPGQKSHSNGGGKSTSPELQDDDHPKLPDEPAETTPKSEVADEANVQTSSPVESPSGMKSPATGSRSRVPSPEIINVDQEPQLEGLADPVSKSDDVEKVNAQPSTSASPRSGSQSPPSGAHPITQSPTVINVNPEPPIHQDSGSVSHTVKHSKPRAPNTLKSFLEGKPRSRRSSFSVASHAQTGKNYTHQAPVTYSSYSHFQPPPAPPTTTFRRAPPLPSDGYYYGRDEIPHYPHPPPSTHAAEAIVTEHAELPQPTPVRAAGREGRQRNKKKNKNKTTFMITTRALIYFSGREGEKDNRKRSPSRRRQYEKDG